MLNQFSPTANTWAEKTYRTLNSKLPPQAALDEDITYNLASYYTGLSTPKEFYPEHKSIEGLPNICMGICCKVAEIMGALPPSAIGSIMDIGINLGADDMRIFSKTIIGAAEISKNNARRFEGTIRICARSINYRTSLVEAANFVTNHINDPISDHFAMSPKPTV